MYWEGKGKLFKLKNKFSAWISNSATYHDYNNLLLKPESLYTVWGVPPEQQTIGHYRVEVRTVNHFHSIYGYIWFDWPRSITSWA